MYNLFLPRDKQEKIDDIIRILKTTGGGKDLATRDYYNRHNTYRGSRRVGTTGDVSPQNEYAWVPNLQIDGEDIVIATDGVGLKRIDGPMHNKIPKGPALRFEEPDKYVASITYSKVNIKDTKYSWMRIERDRAWMGYLSYGDVVNENFGKKYTKENIGEPIPEKPGLFQLYEKCKKLNDRPGAEHYKKLLLQCTDDKYARIYWYFIVRNGKETTLPTKYHERDYDNINEEVPVYEKDFLYDQLDSQLKQEIYFTVKKNLEELKKDMPKVPKHKFNIHDIINMHKDNSDDELTNIARTVAITRAKAWVLQVGGSRDDSGIHDDDREKPNEQYRLHEEYYSKDAGINIPKEYFEIDWRMGARYKHANPTTNTKWASERMKAQISKSGRTSSNDCSPHDEDIKKQIKEVQSMEIQREYWPVTTYEAYKKSFSRFKSTALVYAHAVNSILKELRPMLFDDSVNTFMGEYNLDDDQYYRMKQWFNSVCANLRREVADLLSGMRDDKRLQRENIQARGLLNPGKAHLFEPSGPRLRGYNLRNARRREAFDRAEDAQFNNLMNEVEADEALELAGQDGNNIEHEIDRIIELAENGQDWMWRRLMTIMTAPMVMLDARIEQVFVGELEEKIDSIPDHEMYTLAHQTSHGDNNRPQWTEIREICRRWDAGLPTPTPDIRTRAVRLAFPRGWPNNIRQQEPVIRATSPQQAPLIDQESGLSLKMWAQSFCLQAMPAILAILHKTCFWTIANPIQNIDGVTTIIPGCDWFKHMIFSLVTVEGYIPHLGISRTINSWLVPDAYMRYPLTNNPSGPNVFSAAGMNEFGYVHDNEFYGNIVEQKMTAQYAMWASQHSSRVDHQEHLKKLAAGFQSNSTVTMNEVVAEFQRKSSIENLHSFLGESVNQYTKVDHIPKGMLVENLHQSVAARWGQALVTCQRTEMSMYLQMEHLCYWWLGMSILFWLMDEQMGQKFKNVDALSLVKIGITSGMGYYNYAYKFANLDGEQKVQDIPRLVLGLQKTLFMASFVFTGQVYAALLDDRVDERNEHLVRRLTDRRSWFDWEKMKATVGDYIQPFRVRHTKFIQLSKRFKRDHNEVWDNNQILETNKPSNSANAKYQLAWDIDRLNHPIRDDTLDSKTCTSNIHYPPGTIFSYKNEEYIVVDDLHSMYQHRTIADGQYQGLTSMQASINEEFPHYSFQDFPEEWEDLEDVKEKIDAIKAKLREVFSNFGQQYRIAIRLSNRDDGQPNIRIVSVAAKNYAQSIKNTILVATGATLVMQATQCDFSATSMTNLGVGMTAMASVENENMYYPALTGLAANFAVSTSIGSATQPQKFVGLAAAAVSIAGMYRFVIPRAMQTFDDGRLHHYLRQGWGLLIPMEIRKVAKPQRIVWAGKLWCPLTGRMHEFNANDNPHRGMPGLAAHNAYNDEDARGRFPAVRLYRGQAYGGGRAVANPYLYNMEDGFELTAHGQELHMTFYYWARTNMTWVKTLDSTWVYTPMQHSKNLFFIRVPA
jgi:hypothetical protein